MATNFPETEHSVPVKQQDVGTSVDFQPSIKEGDRFVHPWPFRLPGVFEVGRIAKLHAVNYWKGTSNLPPDEELDRTLPVVKPDPKELAEIPENGIQTMWIGHASVLVQMAGVSILTDPIFSNRCSPKQFFGPKRYRPPPLKIAELPKIDAIVISHNHYDHLDYNSVCELNARFGAELHWYVPLGIKSWMESCGCKSVFELDWWEEANLPTNTSVTLACVPAQHWCRRTAFDLNKALWGGWCILSPQGKLYFAGDTGYCPAFKQIGNKYGPFDLAAIPIGAYEPRWFMKCQHINPEDAVQVHQDIGAKKSLGIHWGTFNLSYEHYLDPPKKVEEAMREKGLKVEDFFTLKHGELWRTGNEATS